MFDLISASQLTHFLAIYGYWAVFAIVAVESMGVPLPGEMTLMAASVYAGTTHHLQVAWVVLAAIAGAVTGDNIGYLLGRKGGAEILRRYGGYIRLDESRLRLAQYLFHRYGGSMVFFGRFIPVLRIWAGFLAGALSMPWRRFLIFNAAGGGAWAILMGMGSYTLGQSAAQAGGLVGLLVGAAATVVMVGLMFGVRRGESRFRQAAECAQFTPTALAA
jgi:membrane protein DedA with SNARE-associated domain